MSNVNEQNGSISLPIW